MVSQFKKPGNDKKTKITGFEMDLIWDGKEYKLAPGKRKVWPNNIVQ